MQVGILSAAPLPGSVKVARRPVKPLVLVRVQVWQPFSGCNVSSRRPCSERGGRRCNSCHPDHFGWLAEQQCPGPENRVSLQAAWVQFLHHPPSSYASCSSKAERPPDKRKTAERYRAGRPFDNQKAEKPKTERTPVKIAKALKLKNQLAGDIA